MQVAIDLHRVSGFDWDEGNRTKNDKHEVSMAEVEQVFLNRPLVLLDDSGHSSQFELRYHAFGTTDEERLLHISFALRDAGRLIRPISARTMSRKERSAFVKATQTPS